MESVSQTAELRQYPDRRKKPTPLISRYTLFGGRRGVVRRASDQRRYQFVDRYGESLLAALLILFGLTLLDGFLTLILVESGLAVEANPVMAFCLDHGATMFLVVKTFVTSLSVCIFCLCHRLTVARVSLACAIVVYLTLVVYEVNMLSGLSGAASALS
jgi:hypothetical protein